MHLNKKRFILQLSHLLVLFCFALSTLPCLAVAANLNSLQHFVDTGKLSPRLKKKLDETGVTEILLTVDASDIRKDASDKRKARGLRFNDQNLIKEKSQKYKQRKNKILSRLLKNNYITLKDYENFPVVHLEVNEQSLIELLQMSDIVAVSENRKLQHHLTQSLPLINATQAHSSGYTGLGTSVAVLDTGLNYLNTAFGDCTAPDPGPPTSCKAPNDPLGTCKIACIAEFDSDSTDDDLDEDGHGTNVSGIVIGVAPDTKLIGLDVFRSNGGAYDSDIIDALNWVISNKTTYNIVAVNMSLGGGVYTSTCDLTGSVTDSITDLKTAGITSSVSSGNDASINSMGYPACAPDALSVGAVYDANGGGISYSVCSDSSRVEDKVTCFSNSANFLKILAPGAPITAADATYYGTSQAAPHAAGAIAVLKEADSSLNVDAVIARLTSTGVPITDHRNSITKPRLDLGAAVSTVITDPLIGFGPGSLDFNAIQNGTLPPTQILTVRNDGVGVMNWTISDDAAWLDLSPTSGIDNADVTVSVTSTNLTPGTHTATITISSPEATNSPQTVPASITVYDSQYSEDFETGDFINLPWVTYGDASWFVQSSTVYGGSYSAQSGPITDDQITSLEVTLNVTSPGFVYFWYKTSTENFWTDRLMFYVDGYNYTEPFEGYYGETPWTRTASVVEIPAGIHTFTWEYEKDGSITSGADAVWVDDIVFPPFNLDIPDIDISPASINFGNVAVGGSSAAQGFTVSNIGAADLLIGTLSIIGTDASQYTIQSDTCSGQTILPAGSCIVDVVFSPTSTGAKTADLTIPSSDPDTPSLSASLSGTGLTPYTLTVSKDGTGVGTVTSAPAGINCGVDCSEIYLDGTTVTLSAAAGGESSFDGWAGGGCSGTGDCVTTITANTTVTATFTQLPPVANFIGSPTSGNAPMIVSFTDTSINSPTSWDWDFGDLQNAAEQNPVHVYKSAGTFSVSLTATNGSGSDPETKTDYISTATCTNPSIQIGLSPYLDIQSAFTAALTDEIIEVQIGDFPEDLVFGDPKTVTFLGGNNCEYDAQAPGTRISSLTISAGTVILENIIIQ